MLLRPGGRADVYCDQGFTPLTIAAERGHELVVQTLLEHGVEVDAKMRDALGGAALSAAAQEGHASIVKLLLAAGAVVDLPRSTGGATSLHMAAKQGHVKVVRLLLRAGADPLRPTGGGTTFLSVATEFNHPAVVTLLQARIAEMACEKASQPTAAAVAVAVEPEAPGL